MKFKLCNNGPPYCIQIPRVGKRTIYIITSAGLCNNKCMLFVFKNFGNLVTVQIKSQTCKTSPHF